jgi:hypothetical protein
MADYITIPRSQYETLLADVEQGIELCEVAAKLRVELSSLRRKIKERLDTDLTPVDLTRSDVEEAFSSSVDYASGAKKAPPVERRGAPPPMPETRRPSSTSTMVGIITPPKKPRDR